ncbi:MAG: hypothetical protein HOO09_06945, partial [Rhodospirillaceae bacterium]|nr:hypothetical protein [Rhodospirillaceae bacterium]
MQSKSLTRRTALAATGAVVAATGAATAATGMSQKPLQAQNKSDVIVIGAGLSGLNAALL